MTDLAVFAQQWGWGITILLATLYFLAKNWQKLGDRLASLFPFWERHQLSKIEAKRFELEQAAKASELTAEERERQDTIVALKDTLKLLRDDKKEEQAERRALQDVIIEIIKEKVRHDAEIIAILQNIAALQIAHTEKLSALTKIIEQIGEK